MNTNYVLSNLNPELSIVMPVYNCELFIRQAIHSILNQTYINFELIIVDDCSTDFSCKIISEFVDSRIKLIKKNNISGVSDSLNIGINKSVGDFIAIMHGDDIARPNRFAIQIEFMKKHYAIGVSGGWIQYFGNESMIWSPPLSHAECLIEILIGSPFAHPTVVMRRSILKNIQTQDIYNKNLSVNEDYELWTRLAGITEFGNIPQILLDYRFHSNQLSQTKKELVLSSFKRLREEFVSRSGGKLNRTQIDYLFSILINSKKSINSRFKLLKSFLLIYMLTEDGLFSEMKIRRLFFDRLISTYNQNYFIRMQLRYFSKLNRRFFKNRI